MAYSRLTRKASTFSSVGDRTCSRTSLDESEEAETEPPEWPKDIHTYALVAALDEGGDSEPGIGMPLVSLCFVIVQLVVLVVVCCDTMLTHCVGHSQCLVGQWCAPTFGIFETPSTDPGICTDCYESYVLQNVSKGRSLDVDALAVAWTNPYTAMDALRARASAAGQGWLAAAVEHCDRTDMMPDQCDFIVVNRKLVSGGSILVLWLTVALVAAVVMEDMNEAGLTLTLLEHALGQRRENPLSRTIVAIFWCSFNIRLFLLPTAVAVTTTAVLLIASPTATNILMNGLVITVLTTLDDVLAQLLPQSLIGRAEQVLAAPFASTASRTASQGSWRSGHKLAAVFTSGGIPVILVHMDFMLGLPMLNTARGAGRLCTAIPQCLMRAWVFCCVAITLSRPVTHFYRSSLLSYMLPFCSQERAKAIDLVLVPLVVCFVFILVLMLGFIIHTIHL